MNVQLLAVRSQLVHQLTKFAFPLLSDDVLYHWAKVAEVVGDLDGAGEFDLLFGVFRGRGHAAQLMADEGHPAILEEKQTGDLFGLLFVEGNE